MTDRYDTYLQVRLTTHDKERIKARAIEAGLKTSDYVRKRALGERCGPLTRDFLRPPLERIAAENMGSVDCPVNTRPEKL